MTKLKILIVALLALFVNISIANAQQWSAITNNTIWNLNTGNVGIGTTTPMGKLDVNGNLLVGTTYKIQLMDFPGQTSWIDMPISANKATGIGTGGAGSNLWIGYAGQAGNWFTNSLAGDVCYKNLNGKLLFGNTSGNAAVAISSGNVGIGIAAPADRLHVVGGNIRLEDNSDYVLIKRSDNVRTFIKTSRSDNTYIGQLRTNGWGDLTYDKSVGIGYNLTGISYGEGNLLVSGIVGIGTTTPSTILQIVKNDASTNQSLTNTAALDIWNTNGSRNTGGQINFRSDANSGAAGVGAVIGYLNKSSNSSGSAGDLVFGIKNNITDVSIIQAMTIQRGGNVGIGTTSPDALLTVNGTIHAKEVKVTVDIPADFVFKPAYKLMPLNLVEQYVKVNNHLPEIPSAGEIIKNGMSVGEMQNKLLQKVEELTLYVIEQQKEIKNLHSELQTLKSK